MTREITPQEEFWKGNFGVEYTARNQQQLLSSANLQFFSRIFRSTYGIKSILEMGANCGMNLRAISSLLPEVAMEAVEINPVAVAELGKTLPDVKVFEGAIQDFAPSGVYDFVFTKGVMIHLNPDDLADVYRKISKLSQRYVLIAEYYNPAPVEITYRGKEGVLFKRDFAGEFLDSHPEFSLIDYGFSYHKDPNFPQDDITWFLLEKHV